jgi:hypothetical protein
MPALLSQRFPATPSPRPSDRASLGPRVHPVCGTWLGFFRVLVFWTSLGLLMAWSLSAWSPHPSAMAVPGGLRAESGVARLLAW